MGVYKDFGSLIGRVKLEVSKANGLKVEVEGLAVILTMALLNLIPTISFLANQVH